MLLPRLGLGEFAEMALVVPTVVAVCAIGVTLTWPAFVRPTMDVQQVA